MCGWECGLLSRGKVPCERVGEGEDCGVSFAVCVGEDSEEESGVDGDVGETVASLSIRFSEFLYLKIFFALFPPPLLLSLSLHPSPSLSLFSPGSRLVTPSVPQTSRFGLTPVLQP